MTWRNAPGLHLSKSQFEHLKTRPFFSIALVHPQAGSPREATILDLRFTNLDLRIGIYLPAGRLAIYELGTSKNSSESRPSVFSKATPRRVATALCHPTIRWGSVCFLRYIHGFGASSLRFLRPHRAFALLTPHRGYYMPPRHAARLLNSPCRVGRQARQISI